MAVKKGTAIIKVGGAVTSSFTSAIKTVQNSLSVIGNSIQKLKKQQNMLKSNPAMQKVGETFSKTGQQAKGMASGVWDSATAVASSMATANAQVADQASLAKALGISGEAFIAWGGLAKEAGCDANVVGELMKNMATKLSEPPQLGEMTPITESIKTLGLAFKDFENLSPEQKFKTIASAIKNLGDTEAAQSIANNLMGGDSSKLFSFLRSRKESVGELLNQQKKLNSLSTQGRQGALVFAQAMGGMGGLFSNVTAEFIGLNSGALAPFVQDFGPKIASLFGINKDGIEAFGVGLGGVLSKVGDFALPMLQVFEEVENTIGIVVDTVGVFGDIAATVGDIMGSNFVGSGSNMVKTLLSIGQSIAPIVSGMIPALIGGIKAVGVAFMSNPIGLALGVIALIIGRIITKWEDLCNAFSSDGIGGAVATFFGFGGDKKDEEDEKEEQSPVGDTYKANRGEKQKKKGSKKSSKKRKNVGSVGSIFKRSQSAKQGVRSSNKKRTRSSSAQKSKVARPVGHTTLKPLSEQHSKASQKKKNSQGRLPKGQQARTANKGHLQSGAQVGQQRKAKTVAQPVPLNKTPASSPAPVASKQITDNRNVTINVYGAEGQSPREIAQAVYAKFIDDSAALYDHAYA
ncbi:hypothetical protein [Halodesulfovibrio aestuarii]|uniref:hypothetical protein n=1 Tax=Halodesulfovibrio aestuarii TaxID=126333 RepID=UPI003D348002